ncbi:DMT family transporter [Amphibiibacter pelophylacis]|uniref:DMT family transporter n=1 Tax=Amphibiibacter pelophylacis TaxID=1799477 RepID=A0ACC6P4C4_9BURK
MNPAPPSAAPAAPTLTVSAAASLLLATALWASNAIVGRYLAAFIPPLTLNWMRWSLALILLLPLAGWVLKPGSPLWRHWKRYAALGLLGIGAYNSLQYWALHTSSALNVTLVGSSTPLWMLLVGRLFFGARIRPLDLAGVALSITGVGVVMTRGEWAALAGIQFVPGDLLMIAASIVWAFYNWLLSRTREPAAVRADWAGFLLAQIALGVMWSSAFAAAEWTLPAVPPALVLTPLVAALVFYVALGPALVSYRFWSLGVQKTNATISGFFINFTPVFAALMSTVLLGEPPQLYHGVAFALIISGVFVSSRR